MSQVCVKNQALANDRWSEVRGHHKEGGVLSVSQVGSAPNIVSTTKWYALRTTEPHLGHTKEQLGAPDSMTSSHKHVTFFTHP